MACGFEFGDALSFGVGVAFCFVSLSEGVCKVEDVFVRGRLFRNCEEEMKHECAGFGRRQLRRRIRIRNLDQNICIQNGV